MQESNRDDRSTHEQESSERPTAPGWGRRTVLKTVGLFGAAGLAGGSAAADAVEANAVETGPEDARPGEAGPGVGDSTAAGSLQPAADWQQFQYDGGNTGYAPDVEPPTDAVASKWTFEAGGVPVASPAVADGTAYVPTEDGTLHAVGVDSGERRWAFETAHDTATAPVVVDGTVYVGADQQVYALAAADGTELWSKRFSDHSVRGIDATGDGPVVQTGESLRALAADSGDERWRSGLNQFTRATPLVSDDGVYVVTDRLNAFGPDGERRWESASIARETFTPPTPVSADGTVYVGGDGGTVFAFDAASGDRLWEQSVESASWQPPRLAADADGVYAGGHPPIVGRGTVTALEPDDGAQRWAIETAGNAMRPAIGDGTVYVGVPPTNGPSGTVYALATDDGSEEWTHETNLAVAPTFGAGALYVGSGSGHLAAVETITGSARWEYSTGGELSTMPAVAGDAVYVGSEANRVFSLSRAAGEQRWEFESERTVVDVAVGDGTVYVGDEGGTVYALATDDGAEQWRFEVERGDRARLVVDDGTVFAKEGARLYAVDASDGSELWRNPFASALQNSAPALANGRVYVSNGDDDDDDVFCFDAESGDVRWSANLGSGYPIVSAPAVAGGTVYVTGDETLVAFDAESGARRWERSWNAGFLSQPAVGPETVVVSDGMSLHAVRTRDGSTEWSVRPGEFVTSPAVIAGDQVLVGTGEGTLHSRSFADGSELWSTGVDEQIDDAFAVVDDGIYLADGDGRMHAFEPATPPSAAFTLGPETPVVGESVTFDGSDSADPDGTVEQYRWDLAGNGRLGPTGETAEFSYDEPGEYTVTLEVTDSQGLTATAERTVTVLEPTPTPTPTATPAPMAAGDGGSGGADGGSEEATGASTPDGADASAGGADTSGGTASESGPGFGAVTAVAAIGAAAVRRIRGGQ